MKDKIFKKRAYGFVVIKAINSNYNADFTGQPRTLPNGTVYATDKALKYTVRYYLDNEYKDKKVFIFKRTNNNLNPYTLAESYNNFFNTNVEKDDKKAIIKNLLSAVDVRFFGVTFAPKGNGGKDIKDKNISIHGPVQITHGINIWKEGNIYSEQIMSPFRNPSDKEGAEKSASTLGRQSKLEEGHYIHHFSINPKTIENIIENVAEEENMIELALTENDISILKEALRKGVSYYDSSSKSGVENEILFYVELNENSKIVLPNFTDLIKMKDDGEKRCFDLKVIKDELEKYKAEIEKCEIYYDKNIICIKNLPEDCVEYTLNGEKYEG
ncbi:CRISPR-associated protein [Marinitoga sp. 1154]|uniref:type I CRISPR-associated protein Cas7 n=1 Tax=Marinitoga sp. 1154 TaxID=1643335 RepID=UPI0015869B2A|nr:type I CRISPR-associated protein Cas7 [Marinitoga sp. 1154]NUU99262.1 CRISPR-associated protein [Marinitoga sp. 1154]